MITIIESTTINPPGQLLIVTGISDSVLKDEGYVVDINDASKICQLEQLYPIPMFTGTGSVVSGIPIVCGGESIDASYLAQCFVYDLNSWMFLTNMSTPRQDVTSAPLNGALWVTGGYTNNGINEDSSTEIIYLNGTVTYGPTLPSARDDHCMVTMHDGKIMILGSDGGTTNSKDVVIYDNANEKFQSAPSLLYERKRSGCTSFTSNLHGDRPVILVAGGEDTATAEVFDYTYNNFWEESK